LEAKKENPKISIGKQILYVAGNMREKGLKFQTENNLSYVAGNMREKGLIGKTDKSDQKAERGTSIRNNSEKPNGISEYGRKNPNSAENYRKKPHMRVGDNREGEPAKARKTENKEN